MKRARPRVEDVAIGWICALPVELSAATVVLDEEYDNISDTAQYVLGRIGAHNVVIACLPAGQYGTTSAAVTAADLRSKFSSVQYWLMVGIGGGVPSPNADVRLGDVVVCRPQHQHGGVIQYDLGRTNPNGQHVRTGWLNAPPAVLGAAVSKLQSTCDLGKSRMQDYLHTDVLFEAEYQHGEGDTCHQCLGHRAIERPPRSEQDIMVHFGLIASGNQVIKDGVTRDKLSTELGGVMCFEMEAAGLMNHFPCLVVRGICDYADSHKNKKWQPCAAASAAACAKEVLSFVPSMAPNTLESEEAAQRPLHTSTDDLHQHPATDPVFVNVSLTNDQRQQYHESLRFDSINTRHAIIRLAHSKTCRWILNQPEYLSWLNDQKLPDHYGFLWIKGHPGTGKSTLMKYILTSTSKSFREVVILSFFFNARGEDIERSTRGLYQSILFQLLDKLPDLQDVLALCPPKLTDTGFFMWEIDSLKVALEHAILRLSTPLLIFVDALDECDEDEIRDMVLLFERLGEVAVRVGLKFRACFSSRHYPFVTIDRSIQLTLEKEENHQQDIANFLHTELRAGHSKFVDEIRSEILQRASGIFLWVVLVVQILNKEFSRGNKHTMKKRLKEIPDGLDRLFEDILMRDNQNIDQLVLCLQWVLYAYRPLKAEELYYAVLAGTEPDSLSAWNSSEIDSSDIERFIVTNSKGLIEVTRSKSRNAQFIHESVRDFLLRGKGLEKPIFGFYDGFEARSHDRLKLCCQTYYLRVGVRETLEIPEELPKASSGPAVELRRQALANFPFLQYAADFVLHHSETADRLGESQEAFVQDFQLHKWVLVNNVLEKHENRRYSADVSLLYILAEQNLPGLIGLEFQQEESIDVKGGRYGFPLIAARESSNEDAVRALLRCHLGERNDISQHELEHAISTTIKDKTPAYKKDSTLALWAVRVGDVILFRIVLPQAKPHSGLPDCHQSDLLSLASVLGRIDIIRSLFAYGLKFDPQSFGNLLMNVLRQGHTEVFKLLLAHGTVIPISHEDVQIMVSSDLPNGDHEVLEPLFTKFDKLHFKKCDALSTATSRGDIDIVKLLLKYGAFSCASDIQAAFMSASRNGYTAIARLLLAHGARTDIVGEDGYGDTALMSAVRHDHTEMVELLLEHGENIYVENKSGHAALMLAVEKGHLGFTKLLLRHCVDIHLKATALTRASEEGHLEVVNLLLEYGADIHSKDNIGRTALIRASREGHLEVVNLLLERGADVHSKDNIGRTALIHASEKGHLEVVNLLLKHGADVHSKDTIFQTALIRASAEGHLEVVNLLLEHNADTSDVDMEGNTALSLAEKRGHSEIVDVLMAHMSGTNVRTSYHSCEYSVMAGPPSATERSDPHD